MSRINLNTLRRDCAFILLLVYYAKINYLLPDHSMLTIYTVFIYLVISGPIFFQVFTSNFNRNLVFSLSLFVFLQIIYFIISNKTVITPRGSVYTSVAELTKVLIVFFGFYISYYFSKGNMISIKYIQVICLIVLFTNIFGFYAKADVIISEKDVDSFTNNAGYNFILLLPFLFFFKKKNLSLIILLISLFFVLISAKRGAIFIASIFTVYYVYKLYLSNFRNFGTNILYVIIIFICLSYFTYDIFLSSEYLQNRFLKTLEGDSSYRDSIYSSLWNYWISSDNIIIYLFGSGLLSSVKNIGFFAHNDWFELLTCTGLLGVLIYLFIFYELFRFSRLKTLESNDKNAIQSILIIWFIKTLFSMGYSAVGMVFPLILLGYIAGKHNREIDFTCKDKEVTSIN